MAYERHRFEEAMRLAERTCEVAPDVSAVRELAGLSAYRAQQWGRAKAHLRRVVELTADPEYLPLIMDCDRANRHLRAVQGTFEELRSADPTPDVLAEGRIVMAGALADDGKFSEGLELLTAAGATKKLRNPAFRHVRLWYTMADLLDRAGDVAGAREFFGRVVAAEPDAYDARARLRELGVATGTPRRAARPRPASHKEPES